ncbi:MAG: Glutamine--fructose-6-phosphate aminotransferase [isomerizing] [Eubacteriales bacterium SKADARSKE-1]|nr:Glutamine--fructose-6-phosphate aminotransferase [isomerizing] [Eubacteriales bacterium SKADARSKE-1]
MCGIVGYVGYDKAAPLLLKGLEKLEYRGYDSAGIAVCNENAIQVTKSKGRLKILSDLTKEGQTLPGNIGIGHTRWATHGVPSVINAHPHLSELKKFAVVHNGIIENYIPIKEKLLKAGKKFVSDTDTEVIAQLAEFYYDGNFFETIKKVLSTLEGSYALAILCDDYPDEIIVAKKNNPLIIGVGVNENFVSSDITAVVSRTKNIIRLNDGELAVIKANDIKIYDSNYNEIKRDPFVVDWDICTSEKCGYDHFMLKEIMEQPLAVKNTIGPRIQNGKIVLDDINFTKEELNNINKISIVGCGSAYHVGCVAKYIFESLLRNPTEVEISSEFRYKNPLIDKNTLVIAISQSGETADTLAAVKEAKKLGAKVLSIVNVVGSSIAAESDSVLYTWAGPEISVATTKAYSTQLTIIYLLAIYMAEKLSKITASEYEFYISEIQNLPVQIEKVLSHKDVVKDLAQKFYNAKNVFFIGRNIDYAVALEGALKAKEISYIHSEAYAAGELKHGPISLIEDGSLVVTLATKEDLFEKMISNIREVKARGAVVILITNERPEDINEVSDFNIFIPKVCEIMRPSLAVVPLQIFSYYIALLKDCDIDKPRNLAKSVTVE